MNAAGGLLRDERGQDLTEYTLIVAAVALASAGLFLGVGGNVNTIWQSGSATVSNAASAVNSGSDNGGPGNHDHQHDGPGNH